MEPASNTPADDSALAVDVTGSQCGALTTTSPTLSTTPTAEPRQRRPGVPIHATIRIKNEDAASPVVADIADVADPDAIRQRNVYVAELPVSFTVEHFRELMGQFGPVASFRLFNDTRRVRSSGRAYGFCLYEAAADAAAAVSGLHGLTIETRTIEVRLSNNAVIQAPPPKPAPPRPNPAPGARRRTAAVPDAQAPETSWPEQGHRAPQKAGNDGARVNSHHRGFNHPPSPHTRVVMPLPPPTVVVGAPMPPPAGFVHVPFLPPPPMAGMPAPLPPSSTGPTVSPFAGPAPPPDTHLAHHANARYPGQPVAVPSVMAPPLPHHHHPHQHAVSPYPGSSSTPVLSYDPSATNQGFGVPAGAAWYRGEPSPPP